MKKAETLEKIKEAEERARGMKTAALEEKDKIVREAKRESLFVLENMEKKAAELHKEKLSEIQAEVNREREKLLEEGRREAEVLKSQASIHVDEAVEFLIKKFEDGVLHAEAKGDE